MSRIFEEILYEVQYSGYADLPRYLQIRVEKWIEKLAQPITNKYWIQNRNEYAKVLLHCIVTRNFRAPFDKNPRGGPLPALPSHLKLSQRSSPHHSKFWDRIHSAMKHSGRGPQNIKPRGTERWKAIAPDLFRASAVPEHDANGDGSTQQAIVDAGLGTGLERRLRQLHMENQHLRKQVQHLAHQRAAESVAKSTLVNMVRRRSPSRSPIQSPRRARVGDPGDEETTIYVSNGVDKSGDSVSTTVLRRKKSQNSLLKTASLTRSPSRSPQRQAQSGLSPQSLRSRSHFNRASRELSTNTPGAVTNSSSHHLVSAQTADSSINLQNAASPLQTLHRSGYDVTPVSAMSVRNSRLDALDLDLSASTGANYGSQRESSLNRTLSSVKKQQVGGQYLGFSEACRAHCKK